MLRALKFYSLFRLVSALLSNSPVSLGRFAPCASQFSSGLLQFLKTSSLFNLVWFLFRHVVFERLAAFAQMIQSLEGGLLLFINFSSLFRAVCSLFNTNSLVVFERFAPVGFAPFTLNYLSKTNLFRLVCPLFSNSPVSLVSYERIAQSSQII